MHINRQIIYFLILLFDITMWSLVSMVESNVSIIVFHLFLLLLLLLLCKIKNIDSNGYILMFISIANRSLLSVIAWYSAPTPERALYTGTNEDSSRFWEAASFPYTDSILAFQDPGFPAINHLFYNISSIISAPHYLANLQIVLFAGIIFPLVVYYAISKISNNKVAFIASLFLALHPTAISFSTGLMRDSLIGVFGWIMIGSVFDIVNDKRTNSVPLNIIYMVISGAVLFNLRVISFAAFFFASIIPLVSKGKNNNTNLGIKVVLFIIIFGFLSYSGLERIDRYENIYSHSENARAGIKTNADVNEFELDKNGLTTKIAEKSPLFFIFLSPIVLMQPIPFYIWSPPPWINGPDAIVDIIIGLGGFYNQILFCFYIISVFYWFKIRDPIGIKFGFYYVLIFCTLSYIGLGQIRMVMAHVYPIFLWGVSQSLYSIWMLSKYEVKQILLRWITALFFLYVSYYMLKDPSFKFVSILGFLCVYILCIDLYRSKNLVNVLPES